MVSGYNRTDPEEQHNKFTLTSSKTEAVHSGFILLTQSNAKKETNNSWRRALLLHESSILEVLVNTNYLPETWKEAFYSALSDSNP